MPEPDHPAPDAEVRPDWQSLPTCPRVDPAFLQARADVIADEGRFSVAPVCAHDSEDEGVGGL